MAEPVGRPLVIGVGNPLRGDDGIGWHVAEQLATRVAGQADVIACHQLTPELAEPVSRAARLIVVDATVQGEPGQVVVTTIGPAELSGGQSHHLDARALLALAQSLFGRCPPATLLAVGGQSFTHSDRLSPQIERSLPGLTDWIVEAVSG